MQRSVRMVVIAVGLTVLAQVFGLALGGTQEPPEQTTEFDVAPLEVRAGENVQVTGRCLLGGSPTNDSLIRLARVVGDSGAEPFDTSTHVTPDAEGRINTAFNVPTSAPPDQYTMSLTCLAGDQALVPVERSVRVLPAAPLPPADPAQPRSAQPRYTG